MKNADDLKTSAANLREHRREVAERDNVGALVEQQHPPPHHLVAVPEAGIDDVTDVSEQPDDNRATSSCSCAGQAT